MITMPNLPHEEARELFLKELEEIHGKFDVNIKLEQMLGHGYFRAKLKGIILFTDIGLIDGSFKVFTFVDGVCSRISSYRENCAYDFSLSETSHENCRTLAKALTKFIQKDNKQYVWVES